MPFPWKKVKSTRLSQFVNDHLRKSQKRRDGSSLVVETGFPTSLIDLFIKNREKLKKSSKKKRGVSQSQSVSLNDFHDPVTVGSPTPFSTPLQCPSPINSPLNTSLTAVSLRASSSCHPSQSSSLFLPLPELAAANVNGTEWGDRNGDIGAQTRLGIEKGVDATGVISAAAKIFIVVVFALTTKSLTVGITISAFLLLFMEYLGKHLFGFSNSCLKAKEWFRFSVKLSCSKCISTSNCDSKCLFQEIEVVQQNSSSNEIQSGMENKEDSCSERWSVNQDKVSNFVLEKEYTAESVELKRIKNKDKLKLKMRRLVPKKFRSSRTENNPVVLKNDKESNVSEQEEQLFTDYEKESEIAISLSASSSCRYGMGDDRHIDNAISRLPEIEEVAAVKKGLTRLSWIYIVPCLTVLIGLIGGRTIALGLTLSWFLLMKLSKTLEKWVKMPLIVSSNENSG